MWPNQLLVKSARNAIAAGADPNRLPSVVLATQIPILLSLSIVVDTKYQPAAVQAAVQSALLDPDAGLFGVNAVGIGQVFFDSEIYAACLAVPGVCAVHHLKLSTRISELRHYILFRRRPRPDGIQDRCGHDRHDPGAGNYYFLADDGTALNMSVEAS